MNLLTNAAGWLGQQLQAHAGSVVSVQQGTTKLTGLTATVVMAEHKVMDGQGFLTLVHTVDFTFVAADLGSLALREGSVITCGTNRYEILPVGDRPGVEDLDPTGVLLTVHTKKIT